METVHILLTGQDAESMTEFDNGETVYCFDRLHADGPRRLIDGRCFVFIDWVLESLSGLEMVRRVRADSRLGDAHVTMILDTDDEEEKRRTLKAGADDYVVGPLDRTAVLDRVMALDTGTAKTSVGNLLELGNLTIDLTALRARWAGETVDLRPNEFRLLHYFAQNPDRVLSRGDLITALGKQEPVIDERTVDVWIGRLRRALRKAGAGERIRTIRSLGYVYDSY